MRSPNEVTIQVHTLNLTRNDTVVAQNVPVLAVWVPGRLAEGWLVQEPQI